MVRQNLLSLRVRPQKQKYIPGLPEFFSLSILQGSFVTHKVYFIWQTLGYLKINASRILLIALQFLLILNLENRHVGAS